ncbi:hypothetical protein [Campylobacter geochelonis]|uniref:hypothetical protein n=1 Tax=Campylobacter geochelonis TaxID=1780362 RepID=UPI000770AE86|nr:hypothetical protein [Campylobacter geochelonis]CZE50836.1 Uncharacterised protein [Campylobacter geochelonis]
MEPQQVNTQQLNRNEIIKQRIQQEKQRQLEIKKLEKIAKEISTLNGKISRLKAKENELFQKLGFKYSSQQ